MADLYEQLREAIRASGTEGITRYRIAKKTGVYESTLSHFMGGKRGLSIRSMELIAEYLGYEITLRWKE